MTTKATYGPVLLAPFVLLAGCRAKSDPAAPKLQTMSFANSDLWMSTLQTIHDSCSPPVNAGTALNSVFDDVTPSLSWDGRTLSFASNRPGGSGGNDLYMSTRTPSGQE